jgi:hypothetical protein
MKSETSVITPRPPPPPPFEVQSEGGSGFPECLTMAAKHAH